nr:MAG TPA: hypothetical protein [Caudoviricetes sp.]
MDIEKLIEQLNGYFEGKDLKRGVALDAATALSTLQAENEKLRAELENYRKGHREEAITALSPPNEPLTLEQLREMDGEPVWVTPTGFWALVISKRGQRVQLMCSDGETVWADKEIELVGPVYRRLPEGEENAQ